MTEVDCSPGAYQAYRRTQDRIANWATDTAHVSHEYKSPFVPRPEAELRQNEFYNQSGKSSRSSSTSSSRHPRKTPTRSSSHGTVERSERERVRSPLRSNTMTVVSPDDSISQIGFGAKKPRARSHSPCSRHRSGSGRHHSSHHRSGTTTTYVVQPQPQYTYGNMAYVQSPGGYVAVQPQQGYFQPQQPAAYVVYPKDGKVHAVYSDGRTQSQQAAYTYASPQPQSGQHSSTSGGGFFSRMFHKSSSGGSRSRSESRR